MKLTVAVPEDLVPAAAVVRELLGKTTDGSAAYAKAPTYVLDDVTYSVIAGDWEDYQILAVENPQIMAAGLSEYRDNYPDISDEDWTQVVTLAAQAQAAFVIWWAGTVDEATDEPVPAPVVSPTTITAVGGLDRGAAITAMGLG